MQTAVQTEPSRIRNMTRPVTENPEGSILKILAYFDLFDYPLLFPEIKQFLDQVISDTALAITLERLLYHKKIFRFDVFYSLQENAALASRRMTGNRRAEKMMPRALRIGRFLQQFPYVRAVGISGSLSKNFADENADIDFFIVAKAGRLWIARTIMHIYKKFTFLTGRQHLYCMNYFLDETALHIEDHNLYTAIEIRTLLPANGNSILDQFFLANPWTNDYLPASHHPVAHSKKAERRNAFKRFIEWVFNSVSGDQLDNYLMRITAQRWKKKQEKGLRNRKGLTAGLITGKHFAKSNPGFFQEKILFLYNKKMEDLRDRMPESFQPLSLSFET